MIKSIYLDMDDVLLDTTGAVLKHFNLENPYDDINNRGNRGLAELCGMHWKDMWYTLDKDFWMNIPKLPWCDTLIQFAYDKVGKENTYILTAPVRSDGCPIAKLNWVEEHYPELQKRTILTRGKYGAIESDSILIDDSQENEEEFAERGKSHLFHLFPAHSNAKHALVDSMLYIDDFVVDLLNTLDW